MDYKRTLEDVLEMGTSKCPDQGMFCRVQTSHWITCWRCIEDKIKESLLESKNNDTPRLDSPS